MSNSYKPFEGRVAVITGASRGIGRAIAELIASRGADIVIADYQYELAKKTASEIASETGQKVIATEVDVSKLDMAQAMAKAVIDEFGKIDILVNNAGITRDDLLMRMKEEDWDDVIAIHLKGSFACGKFAALEMREQGSGRIINITSGAGLMGNFGQTNYASAKAGIVGMTLTWALELSKHNITVNAIRAAGMTRMTEPLLNRAVKKAREARIPVPKPEEIGIYPPEAAAPLVVFLASDYASWINGQVIAIDGPRLVLWSHPRQLRTAYMFPRWTEETLITHFKDSVGAQLEKFGTDIISYFDLLKAPKKQ